MYQQVLRQQPKSSGTHNNLGVALLVQGKIREAIECFQTALRLQPVYADALNNLGNAQTQAGQLEEAEQSLRRALELKPDLAEACNNLARTLIKQGKIEEAKVHFQQSLRLQPHYADAHKNLAACLLLTGDYAQGWAEYDWHWRTGANRDSNSRAGKANRWRAAPCSCTPSLFQFARKTKAAFAPTRCNSFATPINSVPRAPRLSLNVSRPCCLFWRKVRESANSWPAASLCRRLIFMRRFLDCPAPRTRRLRTCRGKFPTCSLRPAHRALEPGARQTRQAPGRLRLARASAGRRRPPQSAAAATFWPASEKIEGVRLVCLQKNLGKPAGHLFESWRAFDAAGKMEAPAAGGLGGLGGLADLAALMKNLDVVITPDIDLAHLAGGLGVTVWVLLAKVPDWRWLMGRDDCPWYPTMRLFRQKEWGKWDDVFEQLAVEVQRQPALEKPEFYWRHGRSLAAAGKLPEAVAVLRHSLELAPNEASLHNELGMALSRQGAKEEALASFEQAVAAKSDHLNALFNLGNILGEMERRRRGRESLSQGAGHSAQYARHAESFGTFVAVEGRARRGRAVLSPGGSSGPDAAGLYLNNLGILLEQENRLDEAVSVFQKVVTCKEGAPDAHKNIGMIHLVRGDFPSGWAEYEWRLKSNGRDRPFEQPRWDGRPLEGKPILIWTEQGLGDTIQFIRYAELVKQRGGYVIVETRDLLRPI